MNEFDIKDRLKQACGGAGGGAVIGGLVGSLFGPAGTAIGIKVGIGLGAASGAAEDPRSEQGKTLRKYAGRGAKWAGKSGYNGKL